MKFNAIDSAASRDKQQHSGMFQSVAAATASQYTDALHWMHIYSLQHNYDTDTVVW